MLHRAQILTTLVLRIWARCSIKYKYATSKHSLWLYSKMLQGEVHHLELILELSRTHCLFPELPGTRSRCSERSTSDHVGSERSTPDHVGSERSTSHHAGWCKCLCLLNVLRGCHSLERCLLNHHLRGCKTLDRRLLHVLWCCHSLDRRLLHVLWGRHHLRAHATDTTGQNRCLLGSQGLRGYHSLHRCLLNHHLRGCNSLDRRLLHVLRGCNSLDRRLLHVLRGCHSLDRRLLHVLWGRHHGSSIASSIASRAHRGHDRGSTHLPPHKG